MRKTNGNYVLAKYDVTDVEIIDNIVKVYIADGHVLRFWLSWWEDLLIN